MAGPSHQLTNRKIQVEQCCSDSKGKQNQRELTIFKIHKETTLDPPLAGKGRALTWQTPVSSRGNRQAKSRC